MSRIQYVDCLYSVYLFSLFVFAKNCSIKDNKKKWIVSNEMTLPSFNFLLRFPLRFTITIIKCVPSPLLRHSAFAWVESPSLSLSLSRLELQQSQHGLRTALQLIIHVPIYAWHRTCVCQCLCIFILVRLSVHTFLLSFSMFGSLFRCASLSVRLCVFVRVCVCVWCSVCSSLQCLI